MTKAAVRMDYDAPSAYRRLIAPRYAPIADALVAAAALRPGEQVLELCAGTGLVSSRVAAAIAPDGWLCAPISRFRCSRWRERASGDLE